MADFNLEKFIDDMQGIAYIRNLDPYNPVVIHIESPSSNTEYRIVAAIIEPSKYVVPVNGIWINLDPKSSHYRKVYRMLDPNKAVEPFNATWEEVTTYDQIFNNAQYFDVLRGERGPQGLPGKDSFIPGPQGEQGPPGNSAGIIIATGIVLSSNSLIFSIGKDAQPTPSVIQFLARMDNLVGDPTFTVVNGTATLTSSGKTATLRYQDMKSSVVTVRASFTDDRGVTYTDDETVAKVVNGSDAVTMLLTNETVTLPADVDGNVTSYVGASTDVIIYVGDTNVTSQWAFTKTDSPGITSTISRNTITVTKLQADTGYVDIKATRLGASPVTRRFTCTRVKTGADGAGSHELILTADAQVFVLDNDDQPNKESIELTAILKNIGGTPTFTVTDGTAQLTVNGNKATLAFDKMQTESVTIKAETTFKSVVYSDSYTIAKLRAGSSAITALLTNENDSVPADYSGVVSSFADAETEMRIYVGANEQTADWTFTKVDGGGLHTTISGNKVTAVGLDSDTGYSDITASRQDYPSVTKRFTLTKQKAGKDGSGANAFNLILSADTQVFIVKKDGSNVPDKLKLKATLQNIDGPVEWTVTAGDATVVSNGTGAELAFTDMRSESATIHVKVEDTFDGQVYTDELTVAKIHEGQDGVTALLTNESVTLTADADGEIEEYDGADTDVVVYIGAQDTTSDWTISKVDSVGLATQLSGVNVKVTSLTVDTAYCDITLSRQGFDSITKRFSVTRVRSGRDGSIKALTIGATTQVFVVKKDGTPSPQQTVFTATLHAMTGDPSFSVIDGQATLTEVGNVATLQFADMLTNSVTVRASLTVDGVTYQDDETVIKLVDGVDTVQAVLTNETVTLTADNMGTIKTFAGASTKMLVFNGITDTTNKWTFTKVDSTGMTSTLIGNVCSVTGMTPETEGGYVDITASRQGFPSITKRFSISKSKSGSDGSSEGLSISGDAQVFVVDSQGASAKPKIKLTANLNNILGTPNWTVTDGNASVTPSADGLTAELTYASMTTETVTVAASLNFGGVQYSDFYTVAKLHNGSDAITMLLTNENSTIAAKADGTVNSFTGVATRVLVYAGATDVTGQWSFSKVDSAGVTSTISANLVSVTAFSQDTGYIDITGQRNGATSITKRMTLSKAKTGADGNAQMIILNSSSQVMAIDKLGVPNPDDIVFTAVLQNITGTPTFSIIDGSGTLTSVSGNKCTLKFSDMVTESCTIRASLTFNGITFTDDETVAKLRSGVDSLTALLTNETAAVPADVNGVVTSLAGVATDMILFQGTTNVTDKYTISKNDGPNVTSTISGKTVTVTTMSADTAYIDISAKLTSAGVVLPAVTKRFSLTKTKTGKPGVDGMSAQLSNETFAFNADFNGNVTNYAGATSTMKVMIGQVDDTANWKITKADSTGITSTLSGATVTVTAIGQTIDTGTVVFTATRTGFPTLNCTFSVSKTKAGKAGDPGTPGMAGVNGKRGSMTFYLSGKAAWSDTDATTAASVQGGPILNDTVVEYNTPTGFSQTRFWNGLAWVVVTQVIDGNLVVKGSIGAQHIAANTIVAGSAIIQAGALDTLQLAGNSVTQAVACVQTGPQKPVSNDNYGTAGAWIEIIRYSNMDITGTQPVIVWGSCNTVGIHAKRPGEVLQPGQGTETYGGTEWYYNLRYTWYSLRVTAYNRFTGFTTHFECQSAVVVLPGTTMPAVINALFPPLPKGTYDFIVSAQISGYAAGNSVLEGIGIRSTVISILETKR